MSDDSNYVSLPLVKLYPAKALPGDLFLKINEKYIKYKNGGDEVDNDKYELFVFKKIQCVFVLKNDAEKFNNWTTELTGNEKQELVKKVGKENTEAVEKHMAVKDEYMTFVTKEVSDEGVQQILDKTRDFISTVKEMKTTEKFISQMRSYSQSTADHGINVATLSTYLAMSLGYTQQTMMETIYLGALLHDYGKTRISAKYLEDPNSEAYKKSMRKHPSLGKTALLLDSGFSDEVLRIIAEHHERFDGKGYPRGIKGSRIYELTKIVSIANIFDNHVMANNDVPIPQAQKIALKELEKDQGHLFDPKILAKSIKALGDVVG